MDWITKHYDQIMLLMGMGKKPSKKVKEAVEETEEVSSKTWHINQAGLDLICEFEGFYAHPYLCPAGVPTIGYGTAYKYPNGVEIKLTDEPISKELAMEYLAHELHDKELVISKHMKKIDLHLNENEFSALVSFAYNLGTSSITGERRTMGGALVSKDRERISKAFLIYNKARVGGKLKVLRGLTRRREAESKLFLTLI